MLTHPPPPKHPRAAHLGALVHPDQLMSPLLGEEEAKFPQQEER